MSEEEESLDDVDDDEDDIGDNLFSDLYSEEGLSDTDDDSVDERSSTATLTTTSTTSTSKPIVFPRHEPENDVFPLNGYLYDGDGEADGGSNDVKPNVDLTTILAKLKSERDKTAARCQYYSTFVLRH